MHVVKKPQELEKESLQDILEFHLEQNLKDYR